MYFQHSAEIWRDYPELVPGLVVADGVHADVSVGAGVARFARMAVERLAGRTEAELPEIRAWRRAFSRWDSSQRNTAARRSSCSDASGARARCRRSTR